MSFRTMCNTSLLLCICSEWNVSPLKHGNNVQIDGRLRTHLYYKTARTYNAPQSNANVLESSPKILKGIVARLFSISASRVVFALMYIEGNMKNFMWKYWITNRIRGDAGADPDVQHRETYFHRHALLHRLCRDRTFKQVMCCRCTRKGGNNVLTLEGVCVYMRRTSTNERKRIGK